MGAIPLDGKGAINQVNLQLRPGAFVAAIPFNAVMTLIEADGQVVAYYNQNELHQVAPGNEADCLEEPTAPAPGAAANDDGADTGLFGCAAAPGSPTTGGLLLAALFLPGLLRLARRRIGG